MIDNLAKKYTVILSGRGVMNIYPKCDYHLFITADLDVRVKRKASQYKDKTETEVRENIIQRDKLQKEVGYYDLSEITKVIDVTESKSVTESTEKILDLIKIPLKI